MSTIGFAIAVLGFTIMTVVSAYFLISGKGRVETNINKVLLFIGCIGLIALLLQKVR